MKKIIYNLLSKKHFKRAISQLRELETLLLSSKARFAIPFVYRGHGYYKTIKCMQNADEIERLHEFICQLRPKNILEIGTAKGGTLYLWTQAASEDATIVSIDLPGGEFGGGYNPCRIPFYTAFKKPRQKIHLLQADSHSEDTKTTAKQLFEYEPLDFLVIDGDHTFEGVKADFELYGPLVKPGGWIALHDILPRADIPEIQVDRFWKLIREKYHTTEIIGIDGSGRKFGWGLIQIPNS